MIIKTKEFDEMLTNDILDITINKQRPYSIKGSYRIKEYGDIITDLDFTGFVFFNEKFIEILKNIINKNKNSNKFIFLHLDCGKYVDFDVPWKIDSKGGCNFDLDQLYSWFENFKKKLPVFGKVDIGFTEIDKILKNIEKIVYSDNLNLGDLVEIEKILEPYADIKWNSYNIMMGYKIFNEKKYYLSEVLRQASTSCVMSFIYSPIIDGEQDFCMIEIGLVDKSLQKTDFLTKMYSYYDPGWYKIFKSYKFFIENKKPDRDGIIPFEKYKDVMKEIEIISATYNRILLLEELDKVSFYKGMNLQKKIYEELGGFGHDLKKIKKECMQKLNDIAKDYLPYFHEHLIKNKKEEFDIYLLRGKEGRIKIPLEQLKYRKEKGLSCPFFDLDIDQFILVYKLAKRLLIEPQKLIDCLVEISNNHKLTIEEIFDIFIKDNGNYIEETDDLNIIVLKDNVGSVIREFRRKDIIEARNAII